MDMAIYRPRGSGVFGIIWGEVNRPATVKLACPNATSIYPTNRQLAASAHLLPR